MLSPLSRGIGTWAGDYEQAVLSSKKCKSALPRLNRDSASEEEDLQHRHGITVKSRAKSASAAFQCVNITDGHLVLPKTYSTRKGALLLYSALNGSGQAIEKTHTDTSKGDKQSVMAGDAPQIHPDFDLTSLHSLAMYILKYGQKDESADGQFFLKFLKRVSNREIDLGAQPGGDMTAYINALRASCYSDQKEAWPDDKGDHSVDTPRFLHRPQTDKCVLRSGSRSPILSCDRLFSSLKSASLRDYPDMSTTMQRQKIAQRSIQSSHIKTGTFYIRDENIQCSGDDGSISDTQSSSMTPRSKSMPSLDRADQLIEHDHEQPVHHIDAEYCEQDDDTELQYMNKSQAVLEAKQDDNGKRAYASSVEENDDDEEVTDNNIFTVDIGLRNHKRDIAISDQRDSSAGIDERLRQYSAQSVDADGERRFDDTSEQGITEPLMPQYTDPKDDNDVFNIAEVNDNLSCTRVRTNLKESARDARTNEKAEMDFSSSGQGLSGTVHVMDPDQNLNDIVNHSTTTSPLSRKNSQQSLTRPASASSLDSDFRTSRPSTPQTMNHLITHTPERRIEISMPTAYRESPSEQTPDLGYANNSRLSMSSVEESNLGHIMSDHSTANRNQIGNVATGADNGVTDREKLSKVMSSEPGHRDILKKTDKQKHSTLHRTQSKHVLNRAQSKQNLVGKRERHHSKSNSTSTEQSLDGKLYSKVLDITSAMTESPEENDHEQPVQVVKDLSQSDIVANTKDEIKRIFVDLPQPKPPSTKLSSSQKGSRTSISSNRRDKSGNQQENIASTDNCSSSDTTESGVMTTEPSMTGLESSVISEDMTHDMLSQVLEVIDLKTDNTVTVDQMTDKWAQLDHAVLASDKHSPATVSHSTAVNSPATPRKPKTRPSGSGNKKSSKKRETTPSGHSSSLEFTQEQIEREKEAIKQQRITDKLKRVEEAREMNEKIRMKEAQKNAQIQEAENKHKEYEERMSELKRDAEEMRYAEEDARCQMTAARTQQRHERDLRRKADLERRKQEAMRRRERERQMADAGREKEREMLKSISDGDMRRHVEEEVQKQTDEDERLAMEKFEDILTSMQQDELLTAQREADEEETRLRLLEREAEEEAMQRLVHERELAEKEREILEVEAMRLRDEQEQCRFELEEEKTRINEERHRRDEQEELLKEEERQRLLELQRLEEEAREKIRLELEVHTQAELIRKTRNIEKHAKLSRLRQGQGEQGVNRSYVFSYYVTWPRDNYEKAMGGGGKAKRGFGGRTKGKAKGKKKGKKKDK